MAVDASDLIGNPYNFGECMAMSCRARFSCDAWQVQEHDCHIEIRREGNMITIHIPSFSFLSKVGVETKDCKIVLNLSEFLVDDYEIPFCEDFYYPTQMIVFDETAKNDPRVSVPALGEFLLEEKKFVFTPSPNFVMGCETCPSTEPAPIGLRNTTMTISVLQSGKRTAAGTLEDAPKEIDLMPQYEVESFDLSAVDINEDGLIDNEEMKWKGKVFRVYAYCNAWEEYVYPVQVVAYKNDETGERIIKIAPMMELINQEEEGKDSKIKIDFEAIEEYLNSDGRGAFKVGKLGDTVNVVYDENKEGFLNTVAGIAFYYHKMLTIVPDEGDIKYFQPIPEENDYVKLLIGMSKTAVLRFTRDENPEYLNLRAEVKIEDDDFDYEEEMDVEDDYACRGTFNAYCIAWQEETHEVELEFSYNSNTKRGTINLPDILFETKGTMSKHQQGEIVIDITTDIVMNYIKYSHFPVGNIGPLKVIDYDGENDGIILYFNGKLIIRPDREDKVAYFSSQLKSTRQIGSKKTKIRFSLEEAIVQYKDIIKEGGGYFSRECFSVTKATCSAWDKETIDIPLLVEWNSLGETRITIPWMKYEVGFEMEKDAKKYAHVIKIKFDEFASALKDANFYLPSGSLGEMEVFNDGICNGVIYYYDNNLIIAPNEEDLNYFQTKRSWGGIIRAGVPKFTMITFTCLREEPENYEDQRPIYPLIKEERCKITLKAWETQDEWLNIIFKLFNPLGDLEVVLRGNLEKEAAVESFSGENPSYEVFEKYVMEIEIPEKIKQLLNGFYFPTGNLVDDETTFKVLVANPGNQNHRYQFDGIVYYYNDKICIAPNGEFDGVTYQYFTKKFAGGDNAKIGLSYNDNFKTRLLTMEPDEYNDLRPDRTVSEYPKSITISCPVHLAAWENNNGVTADITFTLLDSDGNLKIDLPLIAGIVATESGDIFFKHVMYIDIPNDVKTLLNGFYFKNGELANLKVLVNLPESPNSTKQVDGIIYYFNECLNIAPSKLANGQNLRYFTKKDESSSNQLTIGTSTTNTFQTKLVTERPTYTNLRPKDNTNIIATAYCEAWETPNQTPEITQRVIDDNGTIMLTFDKLVYPIKRTMQNNAKGSPIIIDLEMEHGDNQFGGYIPSGKLTFESEARSRMYEPRKYISENNYRYKQPFAYFDGKKLNICPDDTGEFPFFAPLNSLLLTQQSIGVGKNLYFVNTQLTSRGPFSLTFTPLQEKPDYKYEIDNTEDSSSLPLPSYFSEVFFPTYANVDNAVTVAACLLKIENLSPDVDKANKFLVVVYSFSLSFEEWKMLVGERISIDVSDAQEFFNDKFPIITCSCSCCVHRENKTSETINCVLTFNLDDKKLYITPDAGEKSFSSFKLEADSITVNTFDFEFTFIEN